MNALPVVVALGAAGGVGYGLWWLFRGRDKPPEDGDAITDEPPPPAPSPQPDDGKKKSRMCKRSFTYYDVDRWHSPAPVAAALREIGYDVTDSLTTPADVLEIERFQRDAVANAAKGMAGAGSAWIDGKMGPCSLVALSDASDRNVWMTEDAG